MPRRIELPASLADRAFTVAEGLGGGLGASRMRAGDLSRPFHGVRTAGAERDSFEQRCRGYARILKPEEVFSHLTAARLLGVPLPSEWMPEEPVHVAVPAPRRAARGRNVVGHQISRREQYQRTTEQGLPVMGPASTWLQLASLLDEDALVVAGDYLVRVPPVVRDLRRPFATIAELGDATRVSTPGVQRARRAVSRVREGSDSPQETRLRLAIVSAGLPEPELGVEIHDAEGHFVARVDMLYRDLRVIVEYDGDQHRTDARQYDRDIRRIDALYAMGFGIVRIRRSQMHHGAREALRLISFALARAR